MSAKSQHNNILLAILGFTTVVIIVGLVGYFLFKEDPEVIQGSIEVSEYRVACKLPGRIVDLKVKEGDHVKKGDTLAILEIPEIDAQEKVAQATANATTALSDLTSAPTRSQTVESAYQIYQQAVAAKEVAEKTYGRLNRLYNEGVVSAQKRDEAQAALQVAEAQCVATKAQWELAKEGARDESETGGTPTGAGCQGGCEGREVRAARDGTDRYPRWRGIDHLSEGGRTGSAWAVRS